MIEASVKSKIGFVWGFLALSLFFGVVMFALALDPAYPLQSFDFVIVLFSALITVTIFLQFLTERITITQNYIEIRGLIVTRRIPWEEVEEILVAPFFGNTILFGYNLWIRAPQRSYFQRFIWLNSSFYANSHELSKAALEAADRANPALHIVGSVLDTYGHPPYGIFKSKE